MSETKIYLDNAATTRISESVLSAMLPWLKEGYGNASALYSLGRKSSQALARARADCAQALGCEPCEIFFTSGASESDNWAIKSMAALGAGKGKKHIVTSAFEHHAVLNPLKTLEKQGFEVTYLPVGDKGEVKPEDVKAALRDDTALVTVMFVNNEVGTIQPVERIGELCRERGIIFHTDAVQAVGNVPVDVRRQNIDMLSLSGHKIHAMKGTGILYVDKSLALKLPPFIEGGAQESGRRAGTENIAGIVGLAQALKDAANGVGAKNAHLLPLRDRLISELSSLAGARCNGGTDHRIAANVNFSFEGVEGEALLLQLDLRGIAVSSGSACASGSLEPSHVLLAMGLEPKLANGSVRVTMSEFTTEEEIDAFLEALPKALDKLRSLAGWKG